MKRAPAHPDDLALIQRAQKGDKDAFRQIVVTYQDRLAVLVRNMVKDPLIVEDILQEVFVKVYFALESFKNESGFYTWIYRIAANHCLDHLRKKRHPTYSLDQEKDNGEDDASPLSQRVEAPRNEEPQQLVEEDETLKELLGRLKEEHRLILSLREVDGYAYEEIAVILKCNVNTVKSRLNRAREALKIVYEETYGKMGTL